MPLRGGVEVIFCQLLSLCLCLCLDSSQLFCTCLQRFLGHIKSNCWKIYQEDPSRLKSIGSGDYNEDKIQEYVCKLYKAPVKTVDPARSYIFRKGKSLEMMPPTFDALGFKILRADYQASIWLQANQVTITIVSPEASGGWKIVEDKIQPKWMSLPSVPEACVELTSCSCTTKCSTNNCGCFKADRVCFDACGCDNDDCHNPVQYK